MVQLKEVVRVQVLSSNFQQKTPVPVWKVWCRICQCLVYLALTTRPRFEFVCGKMCADWKFLVPETRHYGRARCKRWHKVRVGDSVHVCLMGGFVWIDWDLCIGEMHVQCGRTVGWCLSKRVEKLTFESKIFWPRVASMLSHRARTVECCRTA